MIGNGLKAGARESLHSNAAAANTPYTDFKLATLNAACLYTHMY